MRTVTVLARDTNTVAVIIDRACNLISTQCLVGASAFLSGDPALVLTDFSTPPLSKVAEQLLIPIASAQSDFFVNFEEGQKVFLTPDSPGWFQLNFDV